MQLSLAKPVRVFALPPSLIELTTSQLSYTRGSVIPCSLTYLCDDSQALNLVCTPAATNVSLHRQVKYSQAPAAAEFTVRETLADSVLQISRAVWWPVDEGRSGSRRLDGEIHLPKSLKPSSTVSHFSINVRRSLLSILSI